MIALAWILAIVIGSIITTVVQSSGYRFGALGIVIVYGVLFGIAGAITGSITSKRNAEKARLKEQEDREEEIVRGSCEHNGVMGTLDCGNSFVRFTSTTLLETVYRFEDGIKVSLNNDVITITDKNQNENSFKVKSPEVFRSKIEKYNSPKQSTNQQGPIVSSSLKTPPPNDNNNPGILLETKEPVKGSTQKTENHITATVSSTPSSFLSKGKSQRDNNSEILFCRKCGAKLIKGSAFCRKCGTPIVENTGNAYQVLKKTNKNEASDEGINKNEKKTVLEYNFANQDEFIIYILTHKDSIQDDKLVWTKGSQYLDAYKKGYALFERRQYNAAISAYREALKCNPVGLAARLEIVECLIVQGRNNEAKETLLGDLINYAQYNSSALAKVYRRLGFIYTEQKKYDLAKASFLYSGKIEKSDSVIDELRYIMSVSGDKNLDVDIKALLKRDRVPVLTVSNAYDQLDQKPGDSTKTEYTLIHNNDDKNGHTVEAENEALQPKSPERKANTGDGNIVTGAPVKEVVAGEKKATSNSVMSDKEPGVKDSSEDNKKKEPQKEDKKPVEYIFCRKCGKKIPADSDFCTHCGTTIIRLE